MEVLVSGSSGLIGSAVVATLDADGQRVKRLIRSPVRDPESEVYWDPAKGELAAAGLEGLHAVVHLAGENVATDRWTPEKKTRIRDSRVKGTGLLCDALARLERPPSVLVSASAVGYYGDCGDQTLTEDSAPGTGFLAELCREWEAATQAATAKRIRVVLLRIGMVLSTEGGALAMMLPAFKKGLGGRIGSGRQYLSWITLQDLVGVIKRALTDEQLSGPVNAVSPHPVTNREFTKALGRALGRRTFLPMPAFAARRAFGEIADALLLTSVRAQPARLLEARHAFHNPVLEQALTHVLAG